MIVIGIDPGKYMGLAAVCCFGDEDPCSVIEAITIGGTLDDQCAAVVEFVSDFSSPLVAVEVPHLRSHSPVDPHAIVGLSLRAGCLIGIAKMECQRVVQVKPYEWNRGAPKRITRKRLRESVIGFDRVDSIVSSQQEHAVDAIGIAVYAARRYYDGSAED